MYDDRDDRDWVENLKAGETWARGAFIVLFVLVLWFVRILLVLLAALQFGAMLITGRPVALALPFGRSLSSYVQEIALFVTYNSDRRPWPWSTWPEPGEGPEGGGFGADDEEPAPEPDPGRNRPAPPSDDDAEKEPPAAPSVPQSDNGSGDGQNGDAEPEDDGAGPPRTRKRNAATPPGTSVGTGSFGEPPRPDA